MLTVSQHLTGLTNVSKLLSHLTSRNQCHLYGIGKW